MKKKILVKRKLRSLKIFRRSASASQVDYIFEAFARRNPNFSSRCNCRFEGVCADFNRGKSFMTIRNKTSKRIIVRFNIGGREKWDRGSTFDEKWNNFVNSTERFFGTSPIEPGANFGRYFYNYRPGVVFYKGTLGLEVIDPTTNKQVYRALWYEQDWGKGWEDQWVRCGQDYTFSFYEALIQ